MLDYEVVLVHLRERSFSEKAEGGRGESGKG